MVWNKQHDMEVEKNDITLINVVKLEPVTKDRSQNRANIVTKVKGSLRVSDDSYLYTKMLVFMNIKNVLVV